MLTMHKIFQHLRALSLMKFSIIWFIPKNPMKKLYSSTERKSHRVAAAEQFARKKHRRRIYIERKK